MPVIITEIDRASVIIIVAGEAGSPECIWRNGRPYVIQRDLSHSVPGLVIGPSLLRKTWGLELVQAALL